MHFRVDALFICCIVCSGSSRGIALGFQHHSATPRPTKPSRPTASRYQQTFGPNNISVRHRRFLRYRDGQNRDIDEHALADNTCLRASSTSSAETDGSTDARSEKASDESSAKSGGSFDDFDYMAHWYPVTFARDVPYNKPTKVSLFDVDYVISRSPYVPKAGADPPKRIPGSLADDEEQVYAVLDRCPHKSASLSEGRVIPSCDDDGDVSSARFQCAYHGWSLDGKTGKCADIPQVTASERRDSLPRSRLSSGNSSRADTTAVPALIQQGIIFLFPGGGLEKALSYPPPPRVPELDEPGYRMVPAVRDFPIDWSILLENIMDPDHGLFAHQSKPFDLYTGSKDHPQTVSEEVTRDGKGVILRASVTAVDKLTKYDRERKLEKKDAKLAKKLEERNEDEDDTKPLVATSTFYAPNHIVLARKDDKGKVVSQTVFWVCPTGTGRSRFLSTFVAKLPPFFPLPRWLGHVVLNNFLDQDTHLLGTAQKYVLDAEAKALAEAEQNGAGNRKDGIMARRSLYVYRSPTEKLQARLALFFDKTLPKVPNRSSALRRVVGISMEATPSRELTLDRYEQHTRICPDSMECVAKCSKIRKASKILSALAVATKLIVATSTNPTELMARINDVLVGKTMAIILGVLAATSHLATKLKNAFYFAYPEARRDKDLQKIPFLWGDER